MAHMERDRYKNNQHLNKVCIALTISESVPHANYACKLEAHLGRCTHRPKRLYLRADPALVELDIAPSRQRQAKP